MNKAAFISVNSNTLIKTKSGEDYPKDVNDWEFVTGILPRIKQLHNEGYIICLVSNEGGIEMGHVTMNSVNERMNKIQKEIEDYIRYSINVAFCGKKEDYFKKPNPGMAYHFAIELELSLRDSIMIGNSNADSKFAKNAYIGTYYDIDHFLKSY